MCDWKGVDDNSCGLVVIVVLLLGGTCCVTFRWYSLCGYHIIIIRQNSANDYYREPSEQIESISCTRNANLNQSSNFLPATLTATSLNTNFEDSIFEIDPCTSETPLLRKGEKTKGERVDSELRTLLRKERTTSRVGNNLDEYEGGQCQQDGSGELRKLLVGARPLHERKVDNSLGGYDMVGGGWEHQDGGGELRRFLGPLHRRTTSRHKGWEIST